ncbi:MAG: hypothetical protein ACRDTU_23065 [Micromonosporaceae bacterium]
MATKPEPVSRLGKAIADTELTVTSPDRCVRVRLVGGSELTVTLTRGSFDRHTEESLGKVVTDTLASASQALSHAMRQLRDETAN